MGLRNRAIITTLWRTGMRVNELCTLRMEDINLERGAIRIRGTKDVFADRTVGIDPEGAAVLRDWLDVRADLEGIPSFAPPFCCISKHERGRPIKPAQIRQMFHNLAKKAGIQKRVHPHALRHTLAAELASEGVDLRHIQRILGHKNIAATHRYIDHLNPLDVIDVMGQRSWSEQRAA